MREIMKRYIKPEISTFDINMTNALMAASDVPVDPSGNNTEDRSKGHDFDFWDDDDD